MQQSHKTKVLFIVFGLLIVSALSCLAFTAGGTFSVGAWGGG